MKININEYLTKHIPYSLSIMLAHRAFLNKYYPKHINDSQILEAIFVGSLAKGRMLLETIGIRLNLKGNELNKIDKKRNGDVSALDINGIMVDIDDFKTKNPIDYENIKHFMIAANKYELHLTEQDVTRDLEKYNNAIPVIQRLIDKHIYSTAKNLSIRTDLINKSILI